ncbi:MAG: hypothetical protein J6U20_10985 [Fibrobacter sp.]|nr:hypothetical protein [Fibrobacter sp.]
MYRFALLCASFGLGLVLSACGDSDATSSRESAEAEVSRDSVKTIYDLGECTKKRNGEMVYVQKDDSYHLCKGGNWLKLEATEESPSSEESSSSLKKKSSSSSAKSSSSSKSKSSSSAKSSSSEDLEEPEISEESSSSEVSSSSKNDLLQPREPIMDLSVEYDCEEYKCITTEFLNQDKLDSGIYGQFLDVRDSQVYRTIAIGSQIWLAQNLNYVTEKSECLDEDDANCEKYGRLYYQQEALMACPEGWHLPSDEEWNALDTIVQRLKEGSDGNGNYLKSDSTWTFEIGVDQFGFSGLASGYFGNVHVCGGYHGVYWTSDTYQYRCLLNDKASLYAYKETYSKNWGMSIRCLMDDE